MNKAVAAIKTPVRSLSRYATGAPQCISAYTQGIVVQAEFLAEATGKVAMLIRAEENAESEAEGRMLRRGLTKMQVLVLTAPARGTCDGSCVAQGDVGRR